MSTDSGISQHRCSVMIFWLAILVVLFIVLTSITTVDSHQCAKQNLRFVIIVHRHGDRTPVFSYRTDPYKNRKWKEGKGALTSKGTKQLCNLGLTIKSRYRSLLPAGGKYTKRNTRVISSSRKRCVDSVKSLLRCMTSKTRNGKRIFINQPSTFTKLSPKNDNILLQSMSCPKYDGMLNKIIKNPKLGSAVYKFNRKHRMLYAYVSRHAKEKITNSVRIGEIYDTLLVHSNNKLRLPGWTKSIFPKKLREIKKRSVLLSTENQYMKIIKGGKLATNIVTQLLRKKIRLTQKIQVYSAHDTTLVNLMHALGLIRQTSAEPGYGAALSFELYDCNSRKKDWIVKMVYFPNANKKIPKKISIPGCKYPCEINHFRKTINKIWLPQKKYRVDCNK